MKVVLVFRGEYADTKNYFEFHKSVDMEALLPVGSTIWPYTKTGELDGLTIESIDWHEEGSLYYLHLERSDCIDEDGGATSRWMEENGWIDICKMAAAARAARRAEMQAGDGEASK